ncbi:MAG: L-2-hydroxyglutarate oxidase [Lewinellaceae bacterium]|nr:L-2-hydroxyglutarate oxidase [Phaeodactylibacter sp.]MCB9036042.1 L-2-hydroxyglutarate oxidase [Lewinellaceae bacterium]
MNYDIAIIGAGIVGLATAYQLSRQRPELTIAIIEKEEGPAQHQTGHNSGVIHSGIYYQPGSAKALNCRRGYHYLLEFAREHGIRHDVCGKVIVATNEKERPRLDGILERGLANGLEGIRKISPEELREIEPHVRGLEAIWVPQAGIISYKEVAQKYLELALKHNSDALFGRKVTDISINKEEATVHTDRQAVHCRLVINCAGLYSDKIARMTMPELDIQILPFRGEYYELAPEKQYLANNLIYPVPNPNFPFLGVHYTRMIGGGIEAGPNAVLAFKREGYSRWDINGAELMETLSFPGFQKIARRYWSDGLGELHRSYSKRAFVKALQHLIPEVRYEDLRRGGAGVRAMACDAAGNLIDDFLIRSRRRVINVLNAPSPAATASLAIGETIAGMALGGLDG